MSEYVIVQQFVYEGVTYNCGETVPRLDTKTRDSLLRRGVIVREGEKPNAGIEVLTAEERTELAAYAQRAALRQAEEEERQTAVQEATRQLLGEAKPDEPVVDLLCMFTKPDGARCKRRATHGLYCFQHGGKVNDN